MKSRITHLIHQPQTLTQIHQEVTSELDAIDPNNESAITSLNVNNGPQEFTLALRPKIWGELCNQPKRQHWRITHINRWNGVNQTIEFERSNVQQIASTEYLIELTIKADENTPAGQWRITDAWLYDDVNNRSQRAPGAISQLFYDQVDDNDGAISQLIRKVLPISAEAAVIEVVNSKSLDTDAPVIDKLAVCQQALWT